MSKAADAPYASGNRGLWRKAKCLNRQEFVVVGWTDPEGSRPHVGAWLLGATTPMTAGSAMPAALAQECPRRSLGISAGGSIH